MRRRRLTALIDAASLARTEPALLIIEDAQWVDAVSESMLAEFLTVIPQTPRTAVGQSAAGGVDRGRDTYSDGRLGLLVDEALSEGLGILLRGRQVFIELVVVAYWVFDGRAVEGQCPLLFVWALGDDEMVVTALCMQLDVGRISLLFPCQLINRFGHDLH